MDITHDSMTHSIHTINLGKDDEMVTDVYRKSRADSESHMFSSASSESYADSREEFVFRVMDTTGDTDSDKDLVIHSLNESLHIHKEIMERMHAEKEAFVTKLNQERQEEKEDLERSMQELLEKYQNLENAYWSLMQELEAKKAEYNRMETKFYAFVRSVQATDDDLSTIHSEFNHILSQLNNFCMGIKGSMDRSAGTTFVLTRWQNREEDIRAQFLKASEEENELLDPSIISMFTEKYVMEMLVDQLFSQPVHPGVSVNETFKNLRDWIEPRNPDWAARLRQQVSALVVQQPGDEQAEIDGAINALTGGIIETLSGIYPKLKEQTNPRKKIETIVNRAARLNLAMKGQEIAVQCASITEGTTEFDARLMRPISKGSPDGTVLFVIVPPFVAIDPKDKEYGFIVHGKVFCQK